MPLPRIRRITDAEFATALEIRREVFVREQGCPEEEELDACDARAWHYLVEDGEGAVGTARLIRLDAGTGKIGRLCLLPAARGRGWGAALLRALISDAEAAGMREQVLDAQVNALPFYERFGFGAEGEEFIDAGIPHRRMRRRSRE